MLVLNSKINNSNRNYKMNLKVKFFKDFLNMRKYASHFKKQTYR